MKPWWQAFLALFRREQADKLSLENHEMRLNQLEKFMTTFSEDVTKLETLVPAVIARDQKDEADLVTAKELSGELTSELATAKANEASPDTIKRLEVQIAALEQFMTPPVVTPPVVEAPVAPVVSP